VNKEKLLRFVALLVDNFIEFEPLWFNQERKHVNLSDGTIYKHALEKLAVIQKELQVDGRQETIFEAYLAQAHAMRLHGAYGCCTSSFVFLKYGDHVPLIVSTV
jgi:aromatic ring-opening dioxygenase LigB subunit